MQGIILEDMNNTKWGRAQIISIEFYGVVWDNFQKALKAEGCDYWARLYTQIFENQFELDPEALERRLNVPEEIQNQGAAVVGRYLEELEKGALRLNEARILILGEKGAGKTCIARRLVDPKAPMTTVKESTPGVDTTFWKLDDEDMNVRIWDFAGHTITHAVHQFFLSERCLYLLVCDGRTEQRNRMEYWLDHMKNHGGDSKAIILINEKDDHRAEIKINTLKEKYPIIGVYEFSVEKDAQELEVFRNDVACYIKENPSWKRQEIPTSYYQVKEELESLFHKEEQDHCQELITREVFDAIVAKYHVDNGEHILKDLHALGVSLWYEQMAQYNTLILNPEWISHGVYRIINWVHNQKRYQVALEEFETVFADEVKRFPKDKHRFLFDLMEHYELAYKTKDGKCLIIPHLLKEDRPEKLEPFPVGESLMARYKAEQPLPPGTISRFIVRHNQEIRKQKKQYDVWRYGVVLEDGNDTIALVREEDRTISVSVKGPNKTAYLSRLRETLNDIFAKYQSEKPELQYRVEGFGQIPDEWLAQNPLWLPDRKIFNQARDNRPYYEDRIGRDIDLGPTVIQYDIQAENLMLGGQGNQFVADHSRHTTFNFYDCNIGIQGKINELAGLLEGAGQTEGTQDLMQAAAALERAEGMTDKQEVKKKGVLNGLKRVLDQLEDENSRLHKTVKGIKNGVSIAQDIAQGYNDIAQWVGLPLVPKLFLKKG